MERVFCGSVGWVGVSDGLTSEGVFLPKLDHGENGEGFLSC